MYARTCTLKPVVVTQRGCLREEENHAKDCLPSKAHKVFVHGFVCGPADGNGDARLGV